MLGLVATAACFVLGLSLFSARGGRSDPLLACALALPLGAAATSVLGAVLVRLHVPFTLLTLGVPWLVLLAVSIVAARPRAPQQRPARWPAVLLTAALAGTAVVAMLLDVAILDAASHDVLLVARVLAGAGSLPAGAAVPATSDLGTLLHGAYFLVAGHQPRVLAVPLAASGVAALGVLMARATGPLRREQLFVVIAAVAIAALLPASARMLVTIASPALAGTCLLVAVGLWLRCEQTGDLAPLPLAVLALAAFALQHEGAALAAGPCLVTLVLASRIPRAASARWVAGFLLLDSAYLAAGSWPHVLGPALAGAAWIAAEHPGVRRHLRRTWIAVLLLAAIALCAATGDERTRPMVEALGSALAGKWRPMALAIALAAAAAIAMRARTAGPPVAAAVLALVVAVLVSGTADPDQVATGALAIGVPCLFFALIAAAAGREHQALPALPPEEDRALRGPRWTREDTRTLVVAWLVGAATVAAIEWMLVLVLARSQLSGPAQAVSLLPLLVGNLLPYALALSLALFAADLAAGWAARRVSRARLVVAAAFGLATLPYAIWLARFTFSGPRAHDMALRPVLTVCLAAATALGFGAVVWLAVVRRHQPRWRVVTAVALAATAAAMVTTSRSILPSEYEPLHEFVALWSLLLATIAGREVAALLPARGAVRVRVASAIALAGAVACGAVLARSPALAWLVWGETGASRYLTERWSFLDSDRSAPTEGPTMVVRPRVETDDTRAERRARARAPAPNIVIFSVDGLRQDHVGAYGYTRHPTTPSIDRFARRGVRFTSAFSSYPSTQTFNAALLLGRYVPKADDQLPAGYRDHAMTRLLDRRGYHTFVKSWFEHSSKSTFDPSRFGIDTSIAKPTDKREMERPMQERLDRLAVHLDEARAADAPVLVWMHLLATHPVLGEGLVPHPDFDFGDDRMDRYDSAVAGSDLWLQHVERLMAERLPGGRPTVWIICADHGIKAGSDGRDLREDLVRVPLIVVVDGVAPRAEDIPVDVSLDVAATVVDLAGVDPPRDYDGASLLPVLRGDAAARAAYADRLIPLSYLHWRGAVYRNFKFIEHKAASLFDLTADPMETRNLAEDRSDLLDQMRWIAEEELDRRAARARAAAGGD